MRLQDVMAKYRSTFTTVSGRQFLGEILAPPMLNNSTQMEQPRMFLKLHPNVSMTPGTLIKAHGKVYLVCENETSERGEIVYQTFKLIRMTKQMSWSRVERFLDPVQGIDRAEGIPTDLGPIYCATEYEKQITDKLQIDGEVFLLYTDAALKLNDALDGKYKVMWVDTQLGVTVARVK